MRYRGTIFFLVLFLFIGFLVIFFAGDALVSEITQEASISKGAVVGLADGEQAPVWELEALGGGTRALYDYEGQPLVLVFWASWNPRALDQVTTIDTLLRTKKETLPAVFLAVSSQESESAVVNVAMRGNYTLPILLDETGLVSERYEVSTLPTTYFIDKAGVIRDVFVGVLNEEELRSHTEALLGF